MHGEYVERGELLFEYVETGKGVLLSTETGIIAEVFASAGESIQAGQALYSVVPEDCICVEISVDEKRAANIVLGDALDLEYAADSSESTALGTVARVFEIAEDDLYAVYITPDNTSNLRRGMSVSVKMKDS